MKLLLLGKDGQVGRQLHHVLQGRFEVVAIGRAELDLQDFSALDQALRIHCPDIIVNAAAYTAVDKAESDEAAASRINAGAVELLARHAERTGSLLVHYSTDYVFDGTKGAPYDESDLPNPQSAYGRTKLAGELAVQHSGCRFLVVRTSWVFSVHGGNFVKTILRLARERDSLDVVADQHGAPTSAELIADVTAQCLDASSQGRLDGGIYHLAAAGETTWHALACDVVRQAASCGMALKLRPDAIRAIPSQAYAAPATRPKNSRLDTAKLRFALGVELPHWRTGVSGVVQRLCAPTEGSQ
jgi:dTDP-4-dehydrorhamnose reductase